MYNHHYSAVCNDKKWKNCEISIQVLYYNIAIACNMYYNIAIACNIMNPLKIMFKN